MTHWKELIGVVISVGILSEILHQAFKKIRSLKHKTVREQKRTFHEVLFFPDKALACRAFFQGRNGCRLEKCHFTHKETGLTKLVKYIHEAQQSLDVCVFCISCHQLADALVEAYKRDVVVRVITDNDQTGITGSQIGKLRSKGIKVHHHPSSFLMHHKFIIIDDDVLLNGSFNWTRSAVTSNHENVVITNNSTLVRPFREEFEKLWHLYEPSLYML